MRILRIETPKAAILSAVETITPQIPSTLDAAALAMMARRRQIDGVLADGPLALDNAMLAAALKEQRIASDIAGNADIMLVPDIASGNILAKSLEYFAGATLAGVVVGLSAPVILTSRTDPAPARVASIALAVLLHAAQAKTLGAPRKEAKADAPPPLEQMQAACCRLNA